MKLFKILALSAMNVALTSSSRTEKDPESPGVGGEVIFKRTTDRGWFRTSLDDPTGKLTDQNFPFTLFPYKSTRAEFACDATGRRLEGCGINAVKAECTKETVRYTW